MPVSRGIFITFEGLDGSGKTTQIARLEAYLVERDIGVLVTREPGGSAIGERIRSILLDSRTQGLSAQAELALMFADRAQHVAEVIQPALKAGKVVLCDRYTDSTEAYQGYGRELGSELVLSLHRALCGNLWPDLTLLLDVDLDAGIGRARSRNRKTDSSEGRFEAETEKFFRRVHLGFEEIALGERKRVARIAPGSIQKVAAEVVKAVEAKFPQLLKRRATPGSSARKRG